MEVRKMKVLAVAVVLSLVLAGVAFAGIPSASTSTVDREGQGIAGCDPNVGVVCPASDLGTVLVTVTVRNVYGDVLPGISVTCTATPVVGTFCFCPGENPQSDITDINGQCFFYFTDFGGCGTIQFDAVADGIVLNPSPTIYIASVDTNGDCAVNLTDFIYFAGVYQTPDACCDFDCSGLVNLPDFITFASHYNHICP
jgi:hypothetical protein